MALEPIINHTAQGLDRLLEEYKGKRWLSGLVSMVTDGQQGLEDAASAMPAATRLATAMGAQLDGIGSLVGAERNGLDDDTYRAVIFGTIATNFSDATLPTIINIVLSMWGASAVFVANYGGARIGLAIGSQSTSVAINDLLRQILVQAIGAGIELVELWSFDADGAFAFDGSQSWVRGFGDDSDEPDLSLGGPFGDVFYQDV